MPRTWATQLVIQGESRVSEDSTKMNTTQMVLHRADGLREPKYLDHASIRALA